MVASLLLIVNEKAGRKFQLGRGRQVDPAEVDSRIMLRIGVALLLAAASAQGQLSPTIDKIDVAVTEVDVVVLDSAGKPVPGLTRDVFDLKVNGHARPISNFYEVNRRVDAPAGLPSH